MACVAPHPYARATVLPGTDAAEVVAGGVGQEDLGASAQALGVPLELSPQRGQRGKVAQSARLAHVFLDNHSRE